MKLGFVCPDLLGHLNPTFLETSRRQNYQETTSLVGYVPPTMPGSPWNGNAAADGNVEHLIFDQDPINTGEHHEMLLFIAVKVH